MKKIKIILMIFLSIFIVSTAITVKAAEDETNKTSEIDGFLDDKASDLSCGGIFTEDAVDIIKEILNMVRIIAPILLIVLIAFDLGSAVVSQDNDALSKATKKIVPRLIGTALLFFVPTILRAIFSLDGIKGVLIKNDDPLCNNLINN